ncbi:MAG: glycoside hydrolase family 97 protein [Tannerellaceae bacterium]|nr:glycoside hydrolase family 97 protein [Tannerellaceae bacterium]
MTWIGIFLLGNLFAQQKISLTSPNEEIVLSVTVSDRIYYDVSYNKEILLENNSLDLNVSGTILGKNPKLTGQKKQQVNETLTPVVPFKFSTVQNHYNQLTLSFKGNYKVEFRAFDDGIAYRSITSLPGEIEVMDEGVNLNFPADYLLHLQQPKQFKTAYEEFYSHENSTEWTGQEHMALLPFLIDTRKGYKILLSESDLSDYPCLFLKGDKENSVTSTFPKVPLEFGEEGDRSLKILKEADYIAKTSGKRSFPWRYFVITKEDKQLIENTMTYKLATKNVLKNTDWIQPGQVTWEWWNAASPYGPDVDFVAGFNLETCKYYIDFASHYGIPYLIMDEGWAMSTRDPYTPNPKVNVHELIEYGKEKNVGIILWLTWLVVENNPDVFKTFSEWGVKGVKIDFMDRSDQWMVNYYERVAEEAAKYNILVDYHGSFKPAGLEYKYPHVLSYEGVRGLEQMGGCPPDNTIYLPFMRNAVGPVDFTPGAMINMQPEVYGARRPNSGSMETRTFQLALFVLFESGLQMLCDNPTLYYRNDECTQFITQVPVTWDETKALVAETGEVVVVAKRKGSKWYIGGITNGTERELSLNLDFLGKNKTFQMTYFEDGINAGRQAMDYRRKNKAVKSTDTLQIKMARNGGFAAVIE